MPSTKRSRSPSSEAVVAVASTSHPRKRRGALKLALYGKAQSGKDTAVDWLVATQHGRSMSFAFAIYELADHFQSVAGVEIHKDRRLLQWVGDFGRQYFGEDVWVNKLIRALPRPDVNVFISDVRFPAEAKALNDHGFLIINIMRDDKNIENPLTSEEAEHISENAFQTPEDEQLLDFKIINNGSKQDLYSQLQQIVDACHSVDELM